jgi:hypothetical protein
LVKFQLLLDPIIAITAGSLVAAEAVIAAATGQLGEVLR